MVNKTHMLHIWYIYLHLGHYKVNVGKYSIHAAYGRLNKDKIFSWIDPWMPMYVTNLLDKRRILLPMFFVEWAIQGICLYWINIPHGFKYLVWICLDNFGYNYFILFWGIIYGLMLPSQDLFGCIIVIECLLKNLVSYLICSLQKKLYMFKRYKQILICHSWLQTPSQTVRGAGFGVLNT